MPWPAHHTKPTSKDPSCITGSLSQMHTTPSDLPTSIRFKSAPTEPMYTPPTNLPYPHPSSPLNPL